VLELTLLEITVVLLILSFQSSSVLLFRNRVSVAMTMTLYMSGIFPSISDVYMILLIILALFLLVVLIVFQWTILQLMEKSNSMVVSMLMDVVLVSYMQFHVDHVNRILRQLKN
jgi:hypothetical protein